MSPREELRQLAESVPDTLVEQAKKVLADLCASPELVRRKGSIEEIAARLAADVPDEEWDRLPPDLTDNLDHYLYGTPKR